MIKEIDYSGGISKGRKKMLGVLGNAKSFLYEAHATAKEENMKEMADRIWEVYNFAEKLFLDERKAHWDAADAFEAQMTAAFGPLIKGDKDVW